MNAMRRLTDIVKTIHSGEQHDTKYDSGGAIIWEQDNYYDS